MVKGDTLDKFEGMGETHESTIFKTSLLANGMLSALFDHTVRGVLELIKNTGN